MTTNTDHAREQAQAKLEHIRELMEWLNHAQEPQCTLFEGETCRGDEISQDYGYVGYGHDPEIAGQTIVESVLSTEVRSDWQRDVEDWTASEYRILLSTGGPATRITGTFNEYGEPETARLEYQDWFTPWTAWGQSYGEVGESELLVEFARQFYFGS